MLDMQIDVQGILETQSKFNRLDQMMTRHVDDALGQEITEIRMLAQRLAPKRTGHLASSVFSERTGEWTFKLGARASYVVFVEFGTRFMQARRFITHTLESGVQRLIQRMNAAISESIVEAGTS